MRPLITSNRSRYGFTLVELMVALTIALVLTVVALPRVKEGLKQNVQTRTATMVKATFENARAQAIRTGRPYGIRIHRVNNEVSAGGPVGIDNPIVTPDHGANYCNRLSFVQMAFEYRGDIEGARGYFSLEGTQPSIILLQSQAALLTAIARNNILPDDQPIVPGALVTLGDVAGAFEVAIPPGGTEAIELYTTINAFEPTDLNGDGVANASDAGVRVWLRSRAPIVPATSNFQTGTVVSFRFSTVPIASPMEEVILPGKAVIDLTSSGVGSSGAGFSPRAISNADGWTGTAVWDQPYKVGSTTEFAYRDIIVMFNGSGQLDAIYIDRYVADSGPDTSTASDDYVYARIPIAAPVRLLLGDVRGVVLPESIAVSPERPPAINTGIIPDTYIPTSDVTPNFVNSNNSWLSISPLSGRIELSAVANPVPLANYGTRHPDLIAPTVGDMITARLEDSSRLTRGSR